MRCSAVLDGRQQQRSRAKLRKRLDRPPVDADTAADRVDALVARLEVAYDPKLAVVELERLDLDGYLRLTADIELSAAERLRQLAVHLEGAAEGAQPRGWLALERIYDRATRLCSDDDDRWEVLRSSAISAESCARSVRGDGEGQVRTRRRLFRAAYAAALQLRELDPEDAGSYSLVAQIRYNDPDGALAEALADAERALVLDPAHFWAQWHRAACLRELERWADAVEAYSAMSPAEFTGYRVWRYELLLESRAYCQLRAGRRHAAVREFHALLERYEKNPHLAKEAWWVDVVEAAAGPLKAALAARAKPLVARHASSLLSKLGDEE